MGRNDFTGLLYAQPSALEGCARVLDLGAMFDGYNASADADDADRLAIGADWYAVGADLYRGIRWFQGLAPAQTGAEHGTEPEPR